MEKQKRKRSPDERIKYEDGSRSSSKKSKEKRRRDSEEEDNKSKNRKHHKSSSHHKSSHTKDKKSGDKHKVTGHKRGAQPLQELSNDDYFSKNKEFATWLKEEKRLFFSDLSSESARDLFSDFVLRWNANKLDSRYYAGIATAPRTSHKWNIKK